MVRTDWRLVGKNEVHDMASEPGQETDEADRDPEVLDTMRAYYRRVPTVRAAPASFTDMTSNRWIEVGEDGNYAQELSQWPFPLGCSLSAAGPGATIGGVLITLGRALPVRSVALSAIGGLPRASRAVSKPVASKAGTLSGAGSRTLPARASRERTAAGTG